MGRGGEPSIAIEPTAITAGETVTIRIRGPQGFTYGNDALVEMRDGSAWRPVYQLSHPHYSTPGFTQLDENGQLPGRTVMTLEGYVGDRTFRPTMPGLVPGEYRLSKRFIADVGRSLAERTTISVVRFTVEPA